MYSWLGQNSHGGKNFRLLKSIATFMSHDTICNANSIALEYLQLMRNELITPLVKEGEVGSMLVVRCRGTIRVYASRVCVNLMTCDKLIQPSSCLCIVVWTLICVCSVVSSQS